MRIAQAEHPRVVAEYLRKDLTELIAEAPEGATLVEFHTVVLSHVAAQSEREAIARAMVSARCPVERGQCQCRGALL